MGMDINAIRAKIKEMEQGRPKSKRWKPKDVHTVRLLPLPGDEDLAVVVKWHYGVDNGRAIACPTTWGDDCDFCRLAQDLRSWRDPSTGKDKTEAARKRDWEWFKKVDAATKHYAPIVERKADSTDVDGPFWWEMTPKTYGTVFKICGNDDWNEDHPDGGGLKVLTSLTHALDLVVNLKKKGEKGNTTNFDLTDVEERKKFSPVFKGDLPKAQELLTRLPTIDDITKPVTSEQIAKVFKAWSASMSTSEPPPSDDVERAGDGSAEEVASGGASVDETVRRLEALLEKKG